MRILLIHNILWSHYKAIVFSKLADEIAAVGSDLLVLQTALTGTGQKQLNQVDTLIHKYPYKLLFPSSWESTTIFRRFIAYRENILTFKPDVIILPGYADKAVWVLTIYLKWRKIPFIQTCDSTSLDHTRVWYKERVKQILLNAANLVFCYGSMQQRYLEGLGVPHCKIHVRVQATDNKRFIKAYEQLKKKRYSNDGLRLLYVGRLSPEKNISFLLRALAKTDSTITLTILGSGPDMNTLLALTKYLQLENRVKFVNSVPWTEVIQYYSEYDVFVLPSISEPWGLVVNEAMLCKQPVLVSKHCGCSEDLVEDGGNGFTFDPLDEADLMQKIDKLKANKSSLEMWGERSFEIIQNFNPEKSAKQMIEGLFKVYNQKHG